MSLDDAILFLLGIVQLLIGGYVRAFVTTLRDMNVKLGAVETKLSEIQIAGRVAENNVVRLQNDVGNLGAQITRDRLEAERRMTRLESRLSTIDGEIIRLKTLVQPPGSEH